MMKHDVELQIPSQTIRLLAGLVETGRPASLVEHTYRYGALPPVPVQRGGDPGLVRLIEAAGLLGRGGAGFPTGRKLRTVSALGKATVVVANGMEGEPASGKDRLLLSIAPHLVLDGIEIAARAVGADRAHLVVHRGAPVAARLRAALRERRPAPGLSVSVDEPPPHYVSSEESALVHWLNGADAKPLFVPPRPFEQGVAGRPTSVNNVETLANLALIARYGADWFRAVGDTDEPGTMLVTVSGAVNRPGVIEVATGTMISDVLQLAGGVSGQLRALLIGGYFGSWMPVDLAPSLPLTHAGLRAVDGALGSGIVFALPQSACGLAETAHVMAYMAGQNAGQCGPCVMGLPSIARAFHELAHGPWSARRRNDLDRWLNIVPGRGACRHPDGAVRFAASAHRAFAEDVHHHETVGPCAGAFQRPTLPVRARCAPTWR